MGHLMGGNLTFHGGSACEQQSCTTAQWLKGSAPPTAQGAQLHRSPEKLLGRARHQSLKVNEDRGSASIRILPGEPFHTLQGRALPTMLLRHGLLKKAVGKRDISYLIIVLDKWIWNKQYEITDDLYNKAKITTVILSPQLRSLHTQMSMAY